MNIIRQIITTNFTGRSNHAITRATWHTAVSGARTLYSYFNNPSAQASSTFYVNNLGEIYQYVEFDKAPYSNSNLDSNTRSVTIETWDNGNPNDSVRTPEMYESCAQLAVYIYQNFGIPLTLVNKADALNWNVKGFDKHNYFTTTKTCPAGLDTTRILNRANQILNQNVMIDPTVKQLAGNLAGYTYSDDGAAYETNKWQTEFLGDYGKWSYAFYSKNPAVKAYFVKTWEDKVKTLEADNAELVNDNAVLTDENNKLKTTVQEQSKTINDQETKINDQQATITELNKSLDMKQNQIDSLQQQLTECQAGQKPDWTINIFGLKIIIIKRKS